MKTGDRNACECNETTWYDENGGTVAFVDAIRYIMSICSCEGHCVEVIADEVKE